MNQANLKLVIRDFALEAVQYKIYSESINSAKKDESKIQYKSKLGTSIFSELHFGNIYIDGILQKVHEPIDTVLFVVNQTKNVVLTNIQGRNNSVKEFLGKGDYNITIKGVICGPNGVYPQSEVDSLIQYLTYEQSLPIVSSYLNEVFNINEVVITKFSLPQSEGSQSYQKFEIDCISESPIEVLISEQK
jgi:hypothetical protein